MQQEKYTVVCEPLYEKYFGAKDLGQDRLREALQLAIDLDTHYAPQVQQIMEQRAEMQRKIDTVRQGDYEGLKSALKLLDANPSWRPKSSYPKNFDMYSHCVLEMTGNALNRMGINAFNYITKMNKEISQETGDPLPRICWMCCGEDANGAQIESVLENIRHFRDLITGEARVSHGGKEYRLDYPGEIPPCSFRPRGLHCVEAHLLHGNNGEPIVAPFLDLALWAEYVLPELIKRQSRGVTPLLYIPKMQLATEARMWHDVLKRLEHKYGLQEGTIRTVFLCETFPAVFQLPAMIEAFEGRVIGVNCGRWDYLFSYVQTVAEHTSVKIDGRAANTVLPNKHLVTTDVDLLKKYQIRTAQMCHKYGIMFIGGMNATLPSTNPDPTKRLAENKEILSVSTKNKYDERMFYQCSKTWVAHIGLLEVAKELARVELLEPKDRNIRNIRVTQADLLHAPTKQDLGGANTYDVTTFEDDMYVVLLYMASYLLSRNGAVSVNNKMEDMATAEISLSLMWYYLKHKLLDRQIAISGGIPEKVLPSVQVQLQSKYSPQIPPIALNSLLRELTRLVTKVIQDTEHRPSLEKLLYVLCTRDDPRDRKSVV